MLRRLVQAGLVSLVLLVPAASANTILYTNQTNFLNATGASLVPLPVQLSGSTLTAGSLSFSLGPGATNFHSGDPQYGTPISGGNNLLISGVESFIVLSTPIYSFGFNIFEPTSSALVNGCNTTCVDSTFVITLFSGANVVGTFTIQPPDNTVAFYGFGSSAAFDRITITETVGTNDNEYFGNFYSGTRVVPEPATLLLLGAGLVGVGLRRMRRSRA